VKPNKTIIFLIIALATLDQGIKLVVSHFLTDVEFYVIPNILFIQPWQNVYRGSIPALLGWKTPLFLSIVCTTIGWVLIWAWYRYMKYCTFKWGKWNNVLTAYITFFSAAFVCILIDNMFWGGSLDFLNLHFTRNDYFIFDTKDIYVLIGVISALVYMAAWEILWLNKLSKEELKIERKRTSVFRWLKLGLPEKPRE